MSAKLTGIYLIFLTILFHFCVCWSQSAHPPEVYLILMDEQFEGNQTLETFIDWKRKKGNNVVIILDTDINSNGEPTNN